MRSRWALLLTLVLLLSLLGPNSSVAQDEARYFPETGHWVTGDFLRFYESVADALLVYGFPITDAFQTESVPQNPGMLVQYFEKARFEYHPENPPELEVTVSTLGEYMYELEGPGEPVDSSPILGRCRNIPADGFPVCYSFLSFFDANGGIAQFGYPISGREYQDGVMVQYFQRARFEWHPYLRSTGSWVTLTNLGRQYFDLYESPILLLPNLEDYAANVLSLRAHAFVSRAVAAPDDSLTLYVVVQDQNLHPVTNAQVSVVILFPNGDESRYLMDLTNEHGVTTLSFDFQDAPVGIAEIQVTVSSSLLQTLTRASFRIW
jgi:hypothetical protein